MVYKIDEVDFHLNPIDLGSDFQRMLDCPCTNCNNSCGVIPGFPVPEISDDQLRDFD